MIVLTRGRLVCVKVMESVILGGLCVLKVMESVILGFIEYVCW